MANSAILGQNAPEIITVIMPTLSPLAVPQSYFFSSHVFFGCFIMCILFLPFGECFSTNGLSTGNRISYQWAPHW